jgi:hypothetical protein
VALILKFEDLERSEGRLHLPVEAKYAVFKNDGKAFVQIDTYGRPTRDIPGKVSQSIQLNEKSAKQLVEILRSAFNIA